MTTTIALALSADVDENDHDSEVTVVTLRVGGFPIFEYRTTDWRRSPEEYVEDACKDLLQRLGSGSLGPGRTCVLTGCGEPYHATYTDEGSWFGPLDLCLDHYDQLAR